MADPPFLEADPLKRPRPTGGKCPWSGGLLSVPPTSTPELWEKLLLGSCEGSHLDGRCQGSGWAAAGLG